MSRKKQDAQTPPRTAAEWASFAVSLLLLTCVVGAIVWLWVKEPAGPPRFEVERGARRGRVVSSARGGDERRRRGGGAGEGGGKAGDQRGRGAAGDDDRVPAGEGARGGRADLPRRPDGGERPSSQLPASITGERLAPSPVYNRTRMQTPEARSRLSYDRPSNEEEKSGPLSTLSSGLSLRPEDRVGCSDPPPPVEHAHLEINNRRLRIINSRCRRSITRPSFLGNPGRPSAFDGRRGRTLLGNPRGPSLLLGRFGRGGTLSRPLLRGPFLSGPLLRRAFSGPLPT